jgi:RNA polymerase sigma-70 factor (ECF subfamily)
MDIQAMPDESDLQRLYDEHAQALFAFLLNFTHDENDTRDLLQEIFSRLAREPGLLRGAREERAFLIRLAHNAAIDLIRRRGTREKYHEQLADEEPCIFTATDNTDEAAFRESLSRALAKLPADQRAVVHLKLWEHLTFEQIAEILAISHNTAASRYRYGVDKLREDLRPLYEEIK